MHSGSRQRMPRLSIIIPCKNEETHLPRLLTSIRAQTFKDYEVIVADTHSTDRTAAIAERFGTRVVEGGMPGVGRNRGALHATGDDLLFLDADVVLPSKRFLADVIQEFDAKKADVATCRVKPLSHKLIDRAFHGIYNAYVKLTERVLPHAPGFCIMIRRHTHEGIKGFDESVVFAEDHEYVQRARKSGHRFRLLDSHPIAVSVRRFDKDGRWGIAIKYIFGELRMIVKGPFRKKMPFTYQMGGDERKRRP